MKLSQNLTVPVAYGMEVVQEPLPATVYFCKGTTVPQVRVKTLYICYRTVGNRYNKLTNVTELSGTCTSTRVNTPGIQHSHLHAEHNLENYSALDTREENPSRAVLYRTVLYCDVSRKGI